MGSPEWKRHSGHPRRLVRSHGIELAFRDDEGFHVFGDRMQTEYATTLSIKCNYSIALLGVTIW